MRQNRLLSATNDPKLIFIDFGKQDFVADLVLDLYLYAWLPAIRKLNAGSFKGAAHISERAIVGRSALPFKVGDRLCGDLTRLRQFGLRPIQKRTGGAALCGRKRHFFGNLT